MKHKAPAIRVDSLTVYYRKICALHSISVSIDAGSLLAVVGPNGGGKTTFIKSLLQLVEPTNGTISFFGDSFHAMRDRIAYIPQRSSVDWDFPVSVLDVVLMGRYRKMGWFRGPSQQDIMSAYEALSQLQMSAYADRHISELSGGQQQRVFIARALVQAADIYLLDEPFVGIDHATERMIMGLLKTLRESGKTIVVVHHDLQTLADYFDRVLLLNVRSIGYGTVQEMCMPEYMCAAYGDRTLFVERHRS